MSRSDDIRKIIDGIDDVYLDETSEVLEGRIHIVDRKEKTGISLKWGVAAAAVILGIVGIATFNIGRNMNGTQSGTSFVEETSDVTNVDSSILEGVDVETITLCNSEYPETPEMIINGLPESAYEFVQTYPVVFRGWKGFIRNAVSENRDVHGDIYFNDAFKWYLSVDFSNVDYTYDKNYMNGFLYNTNDDLSLLHYEVSYCEDGRVAIFYFRDRMSGETNVERTGPENLTFCTNPENVIDTKEEYGDSNSENINDGLYSRIAADKLCEIFEDCYGMIKGAHVYFEGDCSTLRYTPFEEPEFSDMDIIRSMLPMLSEEDYINLGLEEYKTLKEKAEIIVNFWYGEK